MQSRDHQLSGFLPANLRLVAWEVTRTCNLSCVHCRAASLDEPYSGELTTDEAIRLIDDISTVSKPILILTGGEPLLRDDIFRIASYGNEKGFRITMATNGTLVTSDIAKEMKKAGVQRVSVSLDGATPESHDNFRQVKGAFDAAVKGIDVLKAHGIPFQINTTVTAVNREELPEIHRLAVSLGAVAHHIFLLVPTGRARDMAGQEIPPEAYEETLNWFYEQRLCHNYIHRIIIIGRNDQPIALHKHASRCDTVSIARNLPKRRRPERSDRYYNLPLKTN